ncbi:Hsp70 family protein [Acanthopleuribacter pedis]|uniref:Hsp70 family protein n=1 Tax=Acanthopleuribacter pedis TaxID=442870 RepID=A0A8J7QDY7_9BACT|nr:Hsp70 family protein [Acanthopleuribacter pedis]MBO1322404.1 Hsp70 family protein [Acanthopleuribacter pedis]
MGRIIGIDLGTTHSLCAVMGNHGPELIPNRVGTFLTPSIVGITADNHVLTGAAAKEMSLIEPGRCAARFKRMMGTNQPFTLGNQSFSPIELSSLLLQSLKRDAEAHLGTAIHEAVITVPAYFNDHQRKATRRAGELAGLKVTRMINEPTAAALTYGFHDRQSERRLLVFDLGGGTLDVTLMDIFESSLEIIATSGSSMLGGEDFTAALMQWACEQQETAGGFLRDADPHRYARLWKECEAAKVRLSWEQETSLRLPEAGGDFAEQPPQLPLSRASFETLLKGFLPRLTACIQKTLSDGQTEPDQVDHAILVGGATRMPMIADLLQTTFNKPALCRYHPDEVVAMGAAVQAGLYENHVAVEDLVLTDVCPFTLGIAVSKQLGRDYRTGYFLPIIHRNTTLPVSREEVVYTLYPNQREVDVMIYQGESRKIKDNLLLGRLKVSGIPPSTEEQEIFIRFTYDLSGVLEVEALIGENGQTFRSVLSQQVKGLDEKDLDEALKRMAQFKFYPRDQEQYQHLLFFAEQALAEVNHHRREELETLIDAYEAALWEAGQVEDGQTWFFDTHHQLRDFLEELGYSLKQPPEESDFGQFKP